MRFKRLILLSICLIILFVATFADAQETQTVLNPNQLITFSLAPEQEKVFVLQMKKGDFADIQSLAREGLNLSFEIYDSTRKELLEESNWFVAPSDGDFLLVIKLAKDQYPEISDAQKISIQYNNKFKLPSGTKLKGVRKVNGFDVKIMITPESSEGGGDTVLLIEKGGQLQKAMSTSGNGEYMGYSFADNIYVYNKDEIYIYSSGSVKTKGGIQIIKTTPEIIKRKIKSTGSRDVYFSDKLPDIVIGYSSGGRVGDSTSFIELGDSVKVSEPSSLYFVDIWKNPKGGLFFETSETPFPFWFTTGCMACARPPSAKAIWEYRNGELRPNFDLMKKLPPSLSVLKSKAQKFRNQLSLKPYRGAKDLNSIETDLEGNLLEDPGLFTKEYLDNASAAYVPPFWDEMIDLIYTGNEELAWQFLDLVWSPQKQGKELFIRDFKNQLLQSPTWQMILEDTRNSRVKFDNTTLPSVVSDSRVPLLNGDKPPTMIGNAQSPSEAYRMLFAAVKSKDPAKIKLMMSRNTIELAENFASKKKKSVDDVVANGFSETTFISSLPQMRDEQIKGVYGAVEVWNETRKQWDDIPFVFAASSWKLAFGDEFGGEWVSPRK
jgi:hypothetical protein